MSLKEHTVKSYDKDIQSIAGTLAEMADMISVSIDMVAEMIINDHPEFVEKVTAHDYKINALDLLIERKVTAMLALRQPMAVDLRYIVSSLKVASNLERIGDQAKSIIKKINRIGTKSFDENVRKSLIEMVTLSKKMVFDSIVAFNDHDVLKADSVLKSDDEVDQTYTRIFGILQPGNFTKSSLSALLTLCLSLRVLSVWRIIRPTSLRSRNTW